MAMKEDKSASSLNAAGLALLQAGQYADAINRFDQALEKDPDYAAASLNRSEAHIN